MNAILNRRSQIRNFVAGNRCPLTESIRLDVWLDVSCLFKTRSEAQQACKGGKVHVNGRSAKPHRDVKAGDIVEITRTLGRKQRVVVRAVFDQRTTGATWAPRTGGNAGGSGRKSGATEKKE